MLDVTKNAPQMAIIQLGEAFKNFFAHRARYPRFRRKGIDDRFALTNDQFRVDGKRFYIPKLGWVRMREALRFTGRIVSATVSRRAHRWHVSITVDATDASLPLAENQGVAGIDLGVSALATLSTGEQWPGPEALRSFLDRLRRLSRPTGGTRAARCARAADTGWQNLHSGHGIGPVPRAGCTTTAMSTRLST